MAATLGVYVGLAAATWFYLRDHYPVKTFWPMQLFEAGWLLILSAALVWRHHLARPPLRRLIPDSLPRHAGWHRGHADRLRICRLRQRHRVTGCRWRR